ncbi:hypothetical protein [Frankia sp. CiP1_Cm_nod2]|uniref:hypothetical protein n=1 Tax=Frankia sp. CiP1_Cm_nod2 TaxID=2897161 RepID=UPI002023F9D1
MQLLTRSTARLVVALAAVAAPALFRARRTPASVTAATPVLTAEPGPIAVADPADVYTPDEMPAVEVIEEAAASYETASEQARTADRGKRKARKLLDRLPAGVYGSWAVDRVESSRQTADLDAIRATYARHGLGDVPMRPCAPSLRVTRAAVLAVAA